MKRIIVTILFCSGSVFAESVCDEVKYRLQASYQLKEDILAAVKKQSLNKSVFEKYIDQGQYEFVIDREEDGIGEGYIMNVQLYMGDRSENQYLSMRYEQEEDVLERQGMILQIVSRKLANECVYFTRFLADKKDAYQLEPVKALSVAIKNNIGGYLSSDILNGFLHANQSDLWTVSLELP